MDQDHVQLRCAARRSAHAGIRNGVYQGLGGFAFGLIGAVAGLVDQPLQAILAGLTPRTLLGGVGRGLLGVVTKPLGGILEFVHNTSAGILGTTGFLTVPQRRAMPSANPLVSSRIQSYEIDDFI